MSDDDSDTQVDMWWHLARYLPESRGLRTKFHTFIAGYLLATRRAIVDETKRLSQAVGAETGNGSTSEDVVLTDATLTPTVLDFLDRLIREQVAPELYTFIQRLRRKAGPWCSAEESIERGAFSSAEILSYLDEPDGDLEQIELPPLLPPHPAQLAGPREKVKLTPLCDFVKTLCSVLSLDACIARQVGEMQRDLFRLLGVGEFSNDALWTPPHEFGEEGRSLVVHLAEVTCATCNFVRDLDVCRDRYIAKTVIESGEATSWVPLCPHCDTPYSRSALETGLLGQLEHFAKQFVLQVSPCISNFHNIPKRNSNFILFFCRICVVRSVYPVGVFRSPHYPVVALKVVVLTVLHLYSSRFAVVRSLFVEDWLSTQRLVELLAFIHSH